MPSSLAAYSMGGVLSFGMPLLNTVVAPRYVWTLWRTGSVFFARIFWPTTTVIMRGVYMQSFWSISAGLEVSGLSVAGAPLLTWTQTFWSFPFFTSTDGSVIGFFAQYGSASRCSLTGVGGLPVKSTVPSIDPSAASAASGRAQPRAIAAILSFVIRPLLEVWERCALPERTFVDKTSGAPRNSAPSVFKLSGTRGRRRVARLAQVHEQVPERLDLRLGIAPERLVVRRRVRRVGEVPEARHPGALLEGIRVLQPGDDPVGAQAALRQLEIGRRARGVLVGPQLADDVAGAALELAHERGCLLRLRRGQRRRLRGEVGERLVRRRREVVHHLGRVRVREMESRHADLQPRAQRDRPLEEPEQPVRLHAPSFPGDDGRSEALVVVVEQVADGAAPSLHHVAVAAAVPEDELFPAVHRLLHRVLPRQELLVGPVAGLPLEEDEQRERLVVREVELGHARLHALVAEHARDVQLLPDPVGVRLPVLGVLGEEAHVAEVEQVGVLAAVLGQLGADLLRFLEPLDVVATEAAVLVDQRLALLRHLLQLLLAPRRVLGRVGVLLIGTQREQVGGDVGRLLIGEPQVRHLRLWPERLGVLHPGMDPLRLRLVSHVPQVGRVVAEGRSFASAGGRALLHHVAAAAPHRVEGLLALRRVALGRAAREQLRVLAVRPQVRADLRHFLIAHLAVLGQHLFGLRALRVRYGVRAHRAGPEVRHARRRAPPLGIADPGVQPAGGGLGRDVGQRRSALGELVVALDRMAAPAADVDEELLPLGEQRRLLDVELLVVALIAFRLHEGALVLAPHHLDLVGQRVVPVVIVLAMAEGLVLDALGLHPLAAVADGAADLLRRVVLHQESPAARVRAEDGLDVEQVGLVRLLERGERVLVGAGLRDAVFGARRLLAFAQRVLGGIARDPLVLRLRRRDHAALRVLEDGLGLRQPARGRSAVRLGALQPAPVGGARAAFGGAGRVHRLRRRGRLPPAGRDGGRRRRQVRSELVVHGLVGVDDLGIERELRLHVRVGHLVLARFQPFPRRREAALADRHVAVLAAVHGGPAPGVLEVLHPVLLHLGPLAGDGLELLLQLLERLLHRVETGLRLVLARLEGLLRLAGLLVVGDGGVVGALLLVDLALPLVVFLLQLRLSLRVLLVPGLAELVVDVVLARLVEAQIELRLRLLDARLLVGLRRRVVGPPLLGVAADGGRRLLQLLAQGLPLGLGARLLEPLLRAGEVFLQMLFLELEELALVALPRPPGEHLVVDRPAGAQGEEHGEPHEGPLEAPQLERLRRHQALRRSGCWG